MARSMTRQKEYELRAADARQRWETLREQGRARRPYMHNSNTLGPQEDVVESRRMTRNRVVLAPPRSAATRRLITENILLLVLLMLSIYGLYRLSIYVLNQS